MTEDVKAHMAELEILAIYFDRPGYSHISDLLRSGLVDLELALCHMQEIEHDERTTEG